MRRAGPLVMSFFLIVLGAAIILQAFGYHALFQNVRVPGSAFGLVGLTFFSARTMVPRQRARLGEGGRPDADGFGAGGWIAIGVVDLIVLATIVQSARRKQQKEKA